MWLATLCVLNHPPTSSPGSVLFLPLDIRWHANVSPSRGTCPSVLGTGESPPVRLRNLGPSIHYTRFSFSKLFVMTRESGVLDWVMGRVVFERNTSCGNEMSRLVKPRSQNSKRLWGKCGRGPPKLSAVVSTEPWGACTEYVAHVLEKLGDLRPLGGVAAGSPSPGPCGNCFCRRVRRRRWAEKMASGQNHLAPPSAST